LMQNEAVGVRLTGSTHNIAVSSNSIGTVSFPTTGAGVWIDTPVTQIGVASNAIQMKNQNNVSPNYAIFLNGPSNVNVTQNSTWGSYNGILANQFGPGDSISQNIIRNCGSAGIRANSNAANALAITGNQFGECGLTDNSGDSAVILTNGSNANLANVTVTNN